MSFRSKVKKLLTPDRVKKELAGQADANMNILKERLEMLERKEEYLFWLSQHQSGETMTETKRRVFLSMPKAEGETRIKQEANLLLLRRLKSICDENGISFSLAFGSMLGAVRHHGFIPWDDDIDICILRDEFERLCEVIKNDNDLALDFYFDPVLGYQFAKVKFSRSDVFFVDVFIMDRFEADGRTLPERYSELKDVNARYIERVKTILQQNGVQCQQMRMPVRNRAVQQEVSTIYQSLRNELSYYGKGSFLCFGFDMPTFIRNQGYVYCCDEMLPFEKDGLLFEGERYDGLKNADLWLQNAYGDYWSLPKSILPGHPELSVMKDDDIDLLKEYGIQDINSIQKQRTLDSLKTIF